MANMLQMCDKKRNWVEQKLFSYILLSGTK